MVAGQYTTIGAVEHVAWLSVGAADEHIDEPEAGERIEIGGQRLAVRMRAVAFDVPRLLDERHRHQPYPELNVEHRCHRQRC